MQQRRTLLLALLLGVIAMCAYAPSLGGGYIFDDRSLIEHNPYIHSFAWWKRWFTTEFWDLGLTTYAEEQRLTYYRPLVTFTYALDWATGGGGPDLYHVANLLWHAAASILAFYTLRRWVGAIGPALLAALLLAVHPTKAESVAWISGRPDLMCLVFLLLAATGVSRRVRGQRWGSSLEIAGTLGAYLSKESALALPFLVVIEHWVARGRPGLNSPVIRGLLRDAAPQLIVAAGYLAVRTVVLPLGEGVSSYSELRRSANRPQLVLETFGRAAELIVIPHDLHVQRGLFTYDDSGRLIFSWPHIAVGSLFLLATTGAILRYRKRLPAISLGLCLFLAAFLPTSNLKPTGLLTVISDRFLYIPILGIGLVLAQVFTLLEREKARIGLAATGLAGTLLAFGSIDRAGDYSNEEAYWTHELEVNPISAEAMRQKVGFLVKRREYDEALVWFARAHRISHRFRDARSHLRLLTDALDLLAFVTPDAQKHDLRNLADFCQRLIDAEPGEARLVHGKARMALTIKATSLELLAANRPALAMSKAQIMSRLGDDSEAVRLLDQVLRLCPDCRTFLHQMPLIFAGAGDYARAHRAIERYIALTGEQGSISRTKLLVTEGQRWAKTAREAADSPAAIHARAMELSTLGLFGRAFEVLRPHEQKFIDIPDVALGYADLAWRAGYAEVSQRVLRRHLPESEVAALTTRWNEALGRRN